MHKQETELIFILDEAPHPFPLHWADAAPQQF